MSTKDTIEIGLTAETLYNQSIESDVFREFDVTFRTADVETTDDVVKAFAGVDAVIDRLNSVPYPRNVIDRLAAEGCRVLARCGIGVDMIDHEWAAERGWRGPPVRCGDESTWGAGPGAATAAG